MSTSSTRLEAAVSRPAWRRWLPVVIWLAIIFTASTALFTPQHTSAFIEPILRAIAPHADERTIGRLHHFVRKIGHVVEYAILAALLARATLAMRATRRWWFVASLLLLAAVAASDEFHQLFVPGREGQISDVLLDITAGMAVLVPILIFRHLAAKKPSNARQ
ncbi:MAG TPA: VanZ family protein [Pirellulales bacterium]|nr:VanZ family protein [Pirellulales bacterium]